MEEVAVLCEQKGFNWEEQCYNQDFLCSQSTLLWF